MELRPKCQLGISKKSIHEVLPNELIEKILMELPTQDLLNRRLVSKLWKAYTSSICRRRHVIIRPSRIFNGTTKHDLMYETFQDLENLPWSACCLDIFKVQSGSGGCMCCKGKGEQYSLSETQLNKFIDTFGAKLHKLTVSGDNIENFISVLHRTPNLEVLISDVRSYTAQNFEFGSYLEFNKLKQLEITVCSAAELKILNFIKNHGNFKSILVRLLPSKQEDIFQLGSLVTTVASVAIDISKFCSMETIKFLTLKELKIQELEFAVPRRRNESYGHDCYQAFENLLLKIASSLRTLIIRDCYKEANSDNHAIRVPLLANLKELKYDFPLFTHTASYIHPFKTNQFPYLEKVVILMSTDVEDNKGVPKIMVFAGTRFDSVKELILDNRDWENSNPMTTDWSEIFPNLVSLTISALNAKTHSYIYEKMTNLTHLSLKVGHKFVITDEYTSLPGDASTIICGYPRAQRTRQKGVTRTLSSLTNLKVLSLDFTDCEVAERLPDCKVHLALLQIHPLERLTFHNIEISMEVKEKLSAHHRHVEFLNWEIQEDTCN